MAGVAENQVRVSQSGTGGFLFNQTSDFQLIQGIQTEQLLHLCASLRARHTAEWTDTGPVPRDSALDSLDGDARMEMLGSTRSS